MWELDHKEVWALKNCCFWTLVLEKTLGSPLDCKEIKPVHPKGNQSWIFIGRTDNEAEAPILWPPDVTHWKKTLMLGKIEGRRRSGRQGMRWLDGITDSIDIIWARPGRWWRTGKLGMLCSPWSHTSRTRPSDWTTTTSWDPDLILFVDDTSKLKLEVIKQDFYQYSIQASTWGKMSPDSRSYCAYYSLSTNQTRN